MYPPAHRLLGITQPAFSTESLFTILRSRWDEWLQKALNSGGKMKKTLKGSQTAFFHCWLTPTKNRKNPDQMEVYPYSIAKLAVKLADDLLTGVGWLAL